MRGEGQGIWIRASRRCEFGKRQVCCEVEKEDCCRYPRAVIRATVQKASDHLGQRMHEPWNNKACRSLLSDCSAPRSSLNNDVTWERSPQDLLIFPRTLSSSHPQGAHCSKQSLSGRGPWILETQDLYSHGHALPKAASPTVLAACVTPAPQVECAAFPAQFNDARCKHVTDSPQ